MALDATGLTVRRQPEIIDDILTSLRVNVDPNFDIRDDELIGQYSQIISHIAAYTESIIQAGYDSKDISKAEGIWLDKLARDKSLTRHTEASSFTNFQKFITKNGTFIPKGTLVRSAVTNLDFSVDSDATISSSNCNEIIYSVKTLLDSTAYDLSVNAVNYQYVSDASATDLEILDGLKALIDADITKTWTATVNATDLTLSVITSDVNRITLSSTTYLEIISVSNELRVTCTLPGNNSESAGSLTRLVSAIPGAISTTNTQDVVEGRARETDEELRLRAITTRGDVVSPTLDGLYDIVSSVAGVSYVNIVENDTSVVDGDGRPGHHIEVVAQGGTDVDIATAIFSTKAAGIGTHGGTTTPIVDDRGQTQYISFSRPTAYNIAVQVQYSLYGEEIPSDDMDNVIKSAVKDHIDLIVLGVDVIPQRISTQIFNNTSGLESVTTSIQQLTISGDTPAPGGWQTTSLPVGPAEYSSIELVDIYPVLV